MSCSKGGLTGGKGTGIPLPLVEVAESARFCEDANRVLYKRKKGSEREVPFSVFRASASKT